MLRAVGIGILAVVSVVVTGAIVAGVVYETVLVIAALGWLGGITLCLPSVVQTSNELDVLLEREPGWLLRHAGIQQRHAFTKGAQRYDLIIDNVGNHSLKDLRRLLTPNGTYVMIGGPSGSSAAAGGWDYARCIGIIVPVLW